MPPKNSLKELIIIFLISFFIGLITLIWLVVQIFRKGLKSVFIVKERITLPSSLDNEEYGKHEYFKLKNRRLKIHCVLSGLKAKPLMLFLHGFPQFWYSWRHQIKEFQNDFRTCAIDMRGYGDSDKPRHISEYTIDKLMGDVEELISALGYKKCILVGHDWGGAVAWSFAAHHPDMVSKLILCNIPHPTTFITAVKTTFAQFKKSWYMFLFQIPLLPTIILRMNDFQTFDLGMLKVTKPGTFTQQDMEAYKYTFNAFEDFERPLNYYRALMLYKSKSELPRILVPTLLIWGNRDIAFVNDLAPDSAKYVEDFTLKIVDGSSHWVQEEYPQIVNKIMREFVF